jgi:DNA polymerase-3 subunit alpha
VSKAYQEGQYLGKPRVQLQWIEQFSSGLIALSGGKGGDIGQALLAQDEPLARIRALYWQALFPNRFYLEIQRTGRPDEVRYNERLVALAAELNLPLVATNDVRFLDEDDFHAHEARVCIHEGYALTDPRRSKEYSAQQYLRSAAEMATLFADLPSALENTVEISKRCSLKLELGKSYLPNFPTPPGTSVEDHLSDLAQKGLNQRLSRLFQSKENSSQPFAMPREEYDQRLLFELKVINSMGFAGYFLIVADFIQWAKNNGVPVGPGRGSGAGSI